MHKGGFEQFWIRPWEGSDGGGGESGMWHPQKVVALLPSFPKSKSLRFMLTLFLSFLIDLCSPEINAPVFLTENETGTCWHKSFFECLRPKLIFSLSAKTKYNHIIAIFVREVNMCRSSPRIGLRWRTWRGKTAFMHSSVAGSSFSNNLYQMQVFIQ